MSQPSADYARDGVVAVRGALDAAGLDLLRHALDHAEQHPSPMASNLATSEDAYFFNDFNTWRKNPAVRQIMSDDALLSIAHDVVGTTTLRLFHDHVLVKRGMSKETPWHQDRPYYLVAGPMNYSVWMSPEAVPRDEGLAFVAGSHLVPALFVPVDFATGAMMQAPDWLEPLDDARLAELTAHLPIVGFDLEPGDALVFDNRIVHMARRSAAAVPRRALSIRYLGDGASLTWNGVNQTPPFHRMGLRFEEGDPPPDAWFPPLPHS
ncbi:MAG: phytanoyl-CoA dioxygenase family protein [Candidatus Nanopelagicales bacterium]